MPSPPFAVSSSHQAVPASTEDRIFDFDGDRLGAAERGRIGGTQSPKHLQVPEVVLQGVNDALPGQDLKRGDLQVVYTVYRPAVLR